MKRILEPYLFKTVRLRLINESDLAMTLAWRNRDSVRRWFKMSNLLSMQQHSNWYKGYSQRDNDFLFIVELIESNEPIGQASIYDINWQTGVAEIGRFIAAPGHAGKGYMKPACVAVTNMAFYHFRLISLILEVFQNNTRAIHIYKDCGFVGKDISTDHLIRMELKTEHH